MFIDQKELECQTEKILSQKKEQGKILEFHENKLYVRNACLSTELYHYFVVTDAGFAMNLSYNDQHIEKSTFEKNAIVAGCSKKRFFTKQSEGAHFCKFSDESDDSDPPFLLTCSVIGLHGEFLYFSGGKPKIKYGNSFNSFDFYQVLKFALYMLMNCGSEETRLAVSKALMIGGEELRISYGTRSE